MRCDMETLNDIEQDIVFFVKQKTFRQREHLERKRKLNAAINKLQHYYIGFSLEWLHNLFRTHNKPLSISDIMVLSRTLRDNENLQRIRTGFLFNSENQAFKPLFSRHYVFKKLNEGDKNLGLGNNKGNECAESSRGAAKKPNMDKRAHRFYC